MQHRCPRSVRTQFCGACAHPVCYRSRFELSEISSMRRTCALQFCMHRLPCSPPRSTSARLACNRRKRGRFTRARGNSRCIWVKPSCASGRSGNGWRQFVGAEWQSQRCTGDVKRRQAGIQPRLRECISGALIDLSASPMDESVRECCPCNGTRQECPWP